MKRKRKKKGGRGGGRRERRERGGLGVGGGKEPCLIIKKLLSLRVSFPILGFSRKKGKSQHCRSSTRAELDGAQLPL